MDEEHLERLIEILDNAASDTEVLISLHHDAAARNVMRRHFDAIQAELIILQNHLDFISAT